MAKLFGTDGVRGVANRKLSPELALRLGQCHAAYLKTIGHEKPRVLIGSDTRISSPMLGSAYVSGLSSQGVEAHCLGIVPTPAVAYLTSRGDFQGGVMISASHNPVPDNGIKIFGGDGYKLSDQASEAVEALYFGVPWEGPTGLDIAQPQHRDDLVSDYLNHLRQVIGDLSGVKVVLDCAFGAGFKVAPELLKSLGAEVIVLHAENDGSRINVNCGSTNLSALRQAVLDHKAHFGAALDGDADRCLAVDETGADVDGDRMMLIFSRWMRGLNQLSNDVVVATVMSNFGLEKALAQDGCKLHRAKVGDRFVLEDMRKLGASLGGEQSGHLIFLEHATTGDGVLCAALLAKRVKESGQPLSQLSHGFVALPQMLVNVRTDDHGQLELPTIQDSIRASSQQLEGRGRILVRPSGTEPLIRLMAEGPDHGELHEILHTLASQFKTSAVGH